LNPKTINITTSIVDYSMDLGPCSPRIAEDILRKKGR
jgi:hypothetical protein